MLERKNIAISKLEMNAGQIEGLPANPRQWTMDEVERLAKSIEETPELLEARGVLVVPKDKKYIVLGGNMRLCAAKSMGLKEVPCIVMPEDTPVEKLKEIVIKDNSSFGAWDFDALANEWDELPLAEWGIPVLNVEEEVEKAKKDEEYAGQVKFTEVLNEEHNYVVLYFDNEVDWLQAESLLGLEAVKDHFKTPRFGVGRVLNGAKTIERLLQYKGKIGVNDED